MWHRSQGLKKDAFRSDCISKDEIETIIVDPFDLKGLSKGGKRRLDILGLELLMEPAKLEDLRRTGGHSVIKSVQLRG